jgi:CubicO group peptidase (beta-lactamase class C family)
MESMKPSRKRIAPILPLLFVMAAAAATPDAGAGKFDEYVNAFAQQDEFMGSVLVAKAGQVVFKKSYGLANRELAAPNTPDTKFRLGSLTKQFTAAAILQLQQQGKLSVDDHISKYIPESPDAWKDITIQELLSHTSGLPNFTSFPDYQKTQRLPTTPLNLIQRFLKKPLDFPPGTKFRYSNSGYIVLGYIIEKVSGESYEAYLKQNIFDPLDLQSTGYDHAAAILKQRASGYLPHGLHLVNAGYIDMSVPFSAGALYSTVNDLYRWDRALYTEKVLPKAALEKMFTPRLGDYGDGWFITQLFDHKIESHEGGINGFASYIARYPDDDACVIVLANLQTAPSGRIGKGLGAILFGQPYEMPKVHTAVEVPDSVLAQHAGKYELGKLEVTIIDQAGRLFWEMKGQDKVELFPESQSKFFMKATDAEITFIPATEKRPATMVLRQNGRSTRLRRAKQ